MRDHEAEFRARGANLAAVGLGDAAYAKAFREESRITFPLLVDAERAAYRAAELRSATLAPRARNSASWSRNCATCSRQKTQP